MHAVKTLMLAILSLWPLFLHMPSANASEERIVVQLKWQHQFQFAGYYAALEQGYYAEAGLNVEFREAVPTEDPVEAVLRGDAQYGVSTTDLVLYRDRGEPVVVLGVVFQHSPLALAARVSNGVMNISDLKGKVLMIEPNSAEMFALLKTEQLEADDVILRTHTFQPDDLIAGRVDAMTVYTTDELYTFRERGVDVLVFQPRAGGIDFYGDMMFTTESRVASNPDEVAAFHLATVKGWQYAMAHPEEIADLIHSKYSQRHSKQKLMYEAERMRILMQPELIEPGYFTRERWKHIVQTYREVGMLSDKPFPLDEFLYRYPQALSLPAWAATALIALAGIVVPLSLFSAYVVRTNRKLNRLVRYDSLTGLYNRRSLYDKLSEMVEEARQRRRGLAVLFLDVDGFKLVNDRYGHKSGDELLAALAGRMKEQIGQGNAAFRFAGDEFIVIISTAQSDAEVANTAKRLLTALAVPVPVEDDRGTVNVTVSVGISLYPEHGQDAQTLIQQADAAMYSVKSRAKNGYAFAERRG